MLDEDRMFVLASIVIDAEFRMAEAKRQQNLVGALAQALFGG